MEYTALMLREESQNMSRRSHHSYPIIRTRAEALAEIRRPCGQFKPVASTEETLRSFIAEKAADIDTLQDALFLGNNTPLNWRRLLDFLHTNKVIATPRFSVRRHRNDYPDFLNFFELLPTKLADLSDGRDVMYSGFGGSFDREEAMSKSVGEMLERYFLSTYKLDAFRTASYFELSKRNNVIDIRQFDFFLDWQKKRFPAFVFDDTSVLRWVQGSEFLSGKSVYLPAQMVYWNYHHTPHGQSGEKILFTQTTSGSAGHFTKDKAVLSALLEAIQRDAFLVYWLNNLTPRVIDIDTIQNSTITSLVEKLRGFNLELMFLNTTSDFKIPIATCVLIDHADPQHLIYAIGSSAGFTLEETLVSSAIEAFSVAHYVTMRGKYDLPENYEPFTSTDISRLERICAWRGQAMGERIRFFISGEKQNAQEFIGDAAYIDTVKKKLAHVVDECAARGKGYEIYTYEVENPVLKKLGYHVVRAIVPELIPLYLTEFAATLNARRLREVPEKIGYRPAKRLNPWPHPFP